MHAGAAIRPGVSGSHGSRSAGGVTLGAPSSVKRVHRALLGLKGLVKMIKDDESTCNEREGTKGPLVLALV